MLASTMLFLPRPRFSHTYLTGDTALILACRLRTTSACAAEDPPLHVKARGRYALYPPRTEVPDERVNWLEPWPDYVPLEFTAKKVLDNDRSINPDGWADPPEPCEREIVERGSFEGDPRFDGSGRPLNPRGRTGIAERGLLGKWGANFAADPVVTRWRPGDGSGGERELQVIVIERRDTGEWALPGGMVDAGETVSMAVRREFEEEAGAIVDGAVRAEFRQLTDELFAAGEVVYAGYVDDPRNTDNAWMESSFVHFHCDARLGEQLPLRAGDDARAVRWVAVGGAEHANLYADHRRWVDAAAAPLLKLRGGGAAAAALNGARPAPRAPSARRRHADVVATAPPSWQDALVEKLASVDEDAVGRAVRELSPLSWEEIGKLLPEAERSLKAERESGRGPTDVAADSRLFDLPRGDAPRVTLWRDQSAWCPYCQKVLMQLEEKRVPYSVRRAPMKCYSGGALQKPPEFLELSPNGLLPVATIDGELYPSSSEILDAVEREFPAHTPLLPSTDAARRAFGAAGALERAFSSAWLSWLTTPHWLPGESERARAFTESLDEIDRHLEAMGRGDGELEAGPYLLGATFSLADVKLAPFMERAAASVPYFRAISIRTGGRWPAIERWFAAMERRPAYSALCGDFYTHCLDLPPQLSPFGISQSPDARRFSAAIDGSDGASWALPLPSGQGLLEPAPLRPDDEARHAAAGALWRNADAVALFACRGPAPLAPSKLPPATAAAMAVTAALSVEAATNGSPYTAISWAATTAVIYDLLGTRAPLADPRAVPVRTLVPLVDAALRLTAAALLEDDERLCAREAKRQLASLEPGAAAPLRDALLYLRARVGVPRDMDYAAARQLRAHLTACVEALAV